MTKRVALVTGGNKGIGFAIVRALCKQFDGEVILTARRVDLGKQAVEKLRRENLYPKFHQLDITDQESIEALKKFISIKYGGLDVLVNNAGITFKDPNQEQRKRIMDTNYFGTLNVSRALLPLLRNHSRVVNVSSMGSSFAIQTCPQGLRKRFLNPNLTKEELDQLLEEYLFFDTRDDFDKSGFRGQFHYTVSKLGLTLFSRIQQRQLESDPRDIIVNSCCPGYVRTDMSALRGHSTIDEGAETPVYLATLPPGIHSPRGEFLADKKIQQWENYVYKRKPKL